MLIEIQIPKTNEAVSPVTFRFEIHKDKLRKSRRREGRYLLQSNLTATDPGELWSHYLLLTGMCQ